MLHWALMLPLVPPPVTPPCNDDVGDGSGCWIGEVAAVPSGGGLGLGMVSGVAILFFYIQSMRANL